jgi:general stress protein YciG
MSGFLNHWFFVKMFLEVVCLSEKKKGKMTVEEAGRLGGEKTAKTHGEEFYSEIGQKGGQRVRKLIQEGKAREEE